MLILRRVVGVIHHWFRWKRWGIRKIHPQSLKGILDKHRRWLRSEYGGKRADLRGVDLRYADLRYIDLRDANLSGASLSGANFSGANLYFANLRGADLRGTNLSGANMYSANLEGANLEGANLMGTYLGNAYGFKFEPLQVMSTRYLITIFDDHVIWGCRRFTFDEVKALTLADCTTEWNEDEFNLNKKIVMDLIGYYRANVINLDEALEEKK